MTRKIEREHGTRARYVQGCRCQPCKDGNAEASRTRRKIHRTLAAINPDLIPEHGTLTAYGEWGCRCEVCTDFASEYDRARRVRAKERRAR